MGRVQACLLSCPTGVLSAEGQHSSPSPRTRETPGCGHSAGRGEAGPEGARAGGRRAARTGTPYVHSSWLWSRFHPPAFSCLPVAPSLGTSSSGLPHHQHSPTFPPVLGDRLGREVGWAGPWVNWEAQDAAGTEVSVGDGSLIGTLSPPL